MVVISSAKQRPAARQNLSAEHWAEAALDAMAAGGIDAVAVEPLARTMGVTKGSFYWHFESREALIRAALELWERREVEELIARAEQEASPRERMHTLFRQAANTGARSERLIGVLSATDHPEARACVRRIADRWRSYVHDCYSALGLSEADARLWATFAFSTFMGTVHMRRDNPDALPAGPEFTQYLKFLIRSMIPRAELKAARETDPSGETYLSVVPLRRT
jgi:AcrR family transcriptional regulator